MEKSLAVGLVGTLLVAGIVLGVTKGKPVSKLPKVKGIVVVMVK